MPAPSTACTSRIKWQAAAPRLPRGGGIRIGIGKDLGLQPGDVPRSIHRVQPLDPLGSARHGVVRPHRRAGATAHRGIRDGRRASRHGYRRHRACRAGRVRDRLRRGRDVRRDLPGTHGRARLVRREGSRSVGPDYPFGRTAEDYDAELEEIEQEWGTFALAQKWMSSLDPETAEDPHEVEDFVGRDVIRDSAGPATPSAGPRWTATSTCAMSCRRSASRRWCCTGSATWKLRSSTVATWRSTSRGQSCGRCPGPPTCGATATICRWRSSDS